MVDLQWLWDWWRHETPASVSPRVPDASARLDPDEIRAGEHYFRVRLLGSSEDIDPGSPYHPGWLVLCALRFRFGNEYATLMSTIRAHHPRSNLPLTPLIPYNGGEVELMVGVLTISHTQSQLRQALEDASGLLVSAALPTALKHTETIAARLRHLIEAGAATLEFALYQRSPFEADSVAPIPGDLVVRPTGSRGLPTGRYGPQESATPISSPRGSRLLLRIEATSEPDDWSHLDTLRIPYEKSLRLLEKANYAEGVATQALVDEAEQEFVAALLETRRTRELTSIVGRNQVLTALQRGFLQARANAGPGIAPKNPGTFAAALKARMTPEEALSRGVIAPEWGPPSTLPPSSTAVLRRIPHMDIDSHSPLKPGATFKVSVYADLLPPREHELSTEIEILAPAVLEVVDTRVWITGTPHFAFPGPREKAFPIPTRTPTTAAVTFDVEVTQQPHTQCQPRLWAHFNHNSRPCGQISVAVQLSGWESTPDAPCTPRAPVDSGASLAIELDAVAPDLIIEIQDPRRARRELQIWARPKHRPAIGPIEWHLPQETGAMVAHFMQQFMDPKAPAASRLLRLLGAGAHLWESLPLEVQDLIWTLIESGTLRTLLVVSAEPYIPWELMVPTRRRNGILEKREPLGVEFALGRWTSQNGLSPPQQLRISNSVVVAPDYPGPQPARLKQAQHEARYVGRVVPGQRLEYPNSATVLQTLTDGDFDLLHFVCHGATTADTAHQAIYLLDGVLTALEMKGLVATGVAFTRKPLVFLNACEVGHPVPTLIGVAGLAKEFADLGAGAVIAPLWSVDDKEASAIACAFYERLWTKTGDRPTSLAEMWCQIRRKAYQHPESCGDTYAAYCFYGDPLAIAHR